MPTDPTSWAIEFRAVFISHPGALIFRLGFAVALVAMFQRVVVAAAVSGFRPHLVGDGLRMLAILGKTVAPLSSTAALTRRAQA